MKRGRQTEEEQSKMKKRHVINIKKEELGRKGVRLMKILTQRMTKKATKMKKKKQKKHLKVLWKQMMKRESQSPLRFAAFLSMSRLQ